MKLTIGSSTKRNWQGLLPFEMVHEQPMNFELSEINERSLREQRLQSLQADYVITAEYE